jgi:hypothetical protein
MAWSRERLMAVLLDFLERAGWSAGEVFFATLLAGGTAVSAAHLPWKYAATLAISAAVASVILTGLQYATKTVKVKFWSDLLIRLIKTFLGSLAASFAASSVFDITTFNWGTAFNIAMVATLAALGKGLLARQPAVAAPVAFATAVDASPSTLPAPTYRAAVGA